jgi:hypothetical protein
MLCQQDHIIDMLRGLTRMTETTGETINEGFTELEAGQDDIDAKLDALSAEETKELAFLADLENNRGTGQLAPDQQARLDDLKARQAKVAASLDAAREELAVADGTEPAPAPVTQPMPSDAPVGEPVTGAADAGTPIADSIPAPVAPVDAVSAPDMATMPVPDAPAGDGNATGAAPVVDEEAGEDPAVPDDEAGEEPAPNET